MQKTKQNNKLNTLVPFGSLKWQKILRSILLVISVGLWVAALVLKERRVLLCFGALLLSSWEILWCCVQEIKTKRVQDVL